MSRREVDVVIAVHDPRRPIERAVGSVLAGGLADLRVTVVVHNTEGAPIRNRLDRFSSDHRLRVIRHVDGIASPAGPFNRGLADADAEFTSIMGSDDELQPGAIDSWLTLARRDRADAVVARVRHASRAAVATPVTRPWRRRGLDPVRDRLSYRSAPLGLVSSERFGDLRFETGLSVGEDLPYVCRLWFAGARVAYDRFGPAYLVHDDAPGRVTLVARPISEEFAYLDAVLGSWFESLEEGQQAAIVVKFLRVHLFGAVFNRQDEDWWTVAERSDLASIASRLLAAGHGIEKVLSRRDRDLLDRILNPDVATGALLEAAVERRSFAHLAALVPRSLLSALHREAPLRFAAASAIQLF